MNNTIAFPSMSLLLEPLVLMPIFELSFDHLI